MLLLPFAPNGLIALKTRSIHRQPSRGIAPEPGSVASAEDSHGSEVLLWISYDGGKTFSGPIIASGDIKQSRLSWGCIVIEDVARTEEPQTTRLCLVWQGGFFQGYTDIYFREITIKQ